MTENLKMLRRKVKKRNLKVLRRKALREKTGYSDMHIWRLEREGKFPKRVQLGPNAVGWIEHEVDEWIESKMAQRPNAA